jgi:predicted metal-binding protein
VKAEEFIQMLDDYELAVLVKFKINSYLPESQHLIFEEIKKRKLEDKLIGLQKTVKSRKRPSHISCPRCKSDKIGKMEFSNNLNRLDEFFTFFSGYPFQEKYNLTECFLCGYKINNP